MSRIEFPRISVSGRLIEKGTIERWFCMKVMNTIATGLKCLEKDPELSDEERLSVFKIEGGLRAILIASPDKLEEIVNNIDKKNLFHNGKKKTSYGDKILKAFDYRRFRSSVLVDLASLLNVKCCPYCNYHYTLYTQIKESRHVKGKAHFQFDHFYDKSHYPILSMSLYNLIPCCPNCNLGKSNKNMSLIFNPYNGEIASYFTFVVSNPIDLYAGSKVDCVDMDVVWKDYIQNDDKNEFEKLTDLKGQARRHRDLVIEIFNRAYLSRYYGFYEFKSISGFSLYELQRIVHGTYMNPKDIDKRPLAKLYQDLWKQAMWCLGMQK